VSGEFIIMLRLASGTDRGNDAAERSDQGRHGQAVVSWSAATERLVNAIFIVIISELFQLSPQVDCTPNQDVVKELPSYRPRSAPLAGKCRSFLDNFLAQSVGIRARNYPSGTL
jgi:hypothetical protein